MYMSMWTLKLFLSPNKNQLGTLNSLSMVYVPYGAMFDAYLIKIPYFPYRDPSTHYHYPSNKLWHFEFIQSNLVSFNT